MSHGYMTKISKAQTENLLLGFLQEYDAGYTIKGYCLVATKYARRKLK